MRSRCREALSAIGMPITGAIGAATFLLAWFLPSEQRIRELREGEQGE